MFSKEQLIAFILELFELKTLPVIIQRQIERFPLELRCSYLEMAEALCFFVEQQDGNYDSRYGIGIIRVVLEDSRAFYKKKREEEERIRASAEKVAQKDAKQNNIKCTKTANFGRKRQLIDLTKIGN